MSSAVVIKVEKKAEKNALIHFDVGEVAWSPDYEVASKLLIGKPLPADWTTKAGEFGPQVFPPRPKGTAPQAAWRNTKEGFLAEQEGRLRWQQVEEERRDRRTAAMQAVALWTTRPEIQKGSGITVTPTSWRGLADELYTWLRQTASGASPSSASPVMRSSQQAAAPEGTSGTGAGEAGTAPEGYGEGPDGAVPATEQSDLEKAARAIGMDEAADLVHKLQVRGADEPATSEDWETATRNGLTPTKAKAIAASLGITVTKATELTREQLAAVINRYLEVKK